MAAMPSWRITYVYSDKSFKTNILRVSVNARGFLGRNITIDLYNPENPYDPDDPMSEQCLTGL